MPPVPEIGHTVCLIRRIEVDGETESQQQGYTDGHIAVAGKIAVYLQRIPIDTEQILQSGIQSGIIENTFHKIHTDVIGNHRFLEQAAYDKEDSLTMGPATN